MALLRQFAITGIRHVPLAATGKRLHQACAQAKGGIIFFPAAQECVPGPKRTIQFRPLMSAFGGKANIVVKGPYVHF
jgi:hypothetical protein